MKEDSFLTLMVSSFNNNGNKVLISYLHSESDSIYVASADIGSDIDNFITTSVEKIINDSTASSWVVVVSDLECQLFDGTLNDNIDLIDKCWIIPSHELRIKRFKKEVMQISRSFFCQCEIVDKRIFRERTIES